jgi:2-polyprenyl-6-methoxyphenol hydroxylase-like FAD-dependent oxidoreductase
MTPAIPNKPHQTAFPLDFLVIGGSSAGLSAAYALQRVGHRVLVLEQNADFFDVSHVSPVSQPESDFFNSRSAGVADTDYRPTCQKSSTTGAWKNASASSALNPT